MMGAPPLYIVWCTWQDCSCYTFAGDERDAAAVARAHAAARPGHEVHVFTPAGGWQRVFKAGEKYLLREPAAGLAGDSGAL